jgi:hypothetical protein
MTNAAPAQRISLWRATWSDLEEASNLWWPWVLGFALAIGIVYFAASGFGPDPELMKQYTPEALKQHPERMQAYVGVLLSGAGPLLLQLLFIILLQSVAHYSFGVLYLRYAMKTTPPEYSVNGYFYWLGKVSWKYLRPILWILIPFVGMFFYIRSTVRYAAVTPLALLRRSPELETSWNLTEGNWWRIFGNQLMLVIIFIFASLIAGAVVGFLIASVVHGDTHAAFYRLVLSLLQGLWASAITLAMSFYSCVVYRTLMREQKTVPSAANPASLPGSIS